MIGASSGPAVTSAVGGAGAGLGPQRAWPLGHVAGGHVPRLRCSAECAMRRIRVKGIGRCPTQTRRLAWWWWLLRLLALHFASLSLHKLVHKRRARCLFLFPFFVFFWMPTKNQASALPRPFTARTCPKLVPLPAVQRQKKTWGGGKEGVIFAVCRPRSGGASPVEGESSGTFYDGQKGQNFTEPRKESQGFRNILLCVSLFFSQRTFFVDCRLFLH